MQTGSVLMRAGDPGEEGRLTKIWKRSGLGRLELEAAGAGDIVSVTGAGTARIADTVGSLDLEEALAPGVIEPPTLRCAHSAIHWTLRTSSRTGTEGIVCMQRTAR